MARHYNKEIMQLFRDPKRMSIRKRDGLFTEALKTKPKDVQASLDAEFGKEVVVPYCPHPIPPL